MAGKSKQCYLKCCNMKQANLQNMASSTDVGAKIYWLYGKRLKLKKSKETMISAKNIYKVLNI